jgi:hypothetical protein
MNGLIIFLGESFRVGQQNTRNRGSKESYSEQIKASNSHITFIEHIIQKFQLNSISLFLSSYNTQYDNDLLTIYNKYLLGYKLYDNVIGLNNLFHNSINSIENIEKYDFILYIRIDLYLKQDFLNCFNPTINMILFPTICWKHASRTGNHPRVNDMILFIPKKYYKYIEKISMSHDIWYELIHTTNLTYDDLDVMINTYHDSDSFKDYNPLYYIVNRCENKNWHSEGYIFNKHNF